MNRQDAKLLIATSTLQSLNHDQVGEILSEYWHYDSIAEINADIQSAELPALDEKAVRIMVSEDTPANIDKDIFKPLLIDYLMLKLMYSSNSYLEHRLNLMGQPVKVQGAIETAGICPCCKYLSIGPAEEGLWDICPVCFWENGGDGPNYLSLADAQANFKSFGAINERSLQFVNPEGTMKYVKTV